MSQFKPASRQEIADLQTTLLACVIALDNLGRQISEEQFLRAARFAVDLAYRTLPAGGQNPVPSGMNAGWRNVGEDPKHPLALKRLKEVVQ